MDAHFLVDPDLPGPPELETSPTCTCPTPLPEARATWKGAARTFCSRCDLPVQLDFAGR